MLFCVDAGILTCSEQTRLGCVVSEACLKSWPKNSSSVHVGRVDNINSCLRAFGVDGQSTNKRRHHNDCDAPSEFLPRSALRSFAVLGDGVFGSVDTLQYRQRMTELGQRALTDQSFAEELMYANLSSPNVARNGMQLFQESGMKPLLRHIAKVSGTGSNVRLVVLSPDGEPLIPL